MMLHRSQLIHTAQTAAGALLCLLSFGLRFSHGRLASFNFLFVADSSNLKRNRRFKLRSKSTKAFPLL
jgi:hypothetical protein